jgi:hypothetical protein
MVTHFCSIDIGVRTTSKKASVKNKAIHFSIPSSRNLFKAIERFLKVTNKIEVILNISRELFQVNLFWQIPMQGGFNIHLMDKADAIHFGYKDKGFSIVNSFYLRKSFVTNLALCFSTLNLMHI